MVNKPRVDVQYSIALKDGQDTGGKQVNEVIQVVYYSSMHRPEGAMTSVDNAEDMEVVPLWNNKR